MTVEQTAILDMIRTIITSGSDGLFFIDGPSRTGKMFIENLLLNWVQGNSQIALAVASSGIATTLLHHGRTSHSRFHIPIDIQPESVCAVPAQSGLAELLRSTSLIIWDEVSSQNRYCFEAVNRTLQDLRKNDEWFGGIPVVFAGDNHITTGLINIGDFRQCLPVIPKGSPAQILASSIVHASFWKDVHIFKLMVNMRLLAQSERMTPPNRLKAESFAKWLLMVGEGTDNTVPLTELPIGMSMIKYYAHCLLHRPMHARRQGHNRGSYRRNISGSP